MYSHIWKKYVPVIKILIKRSAVAEQTLDLNRLDFERAGSGRKTGYKFTVEFINGKLNLNTAGNNEPARSFAQAVLEDEVIKALLQENNYEFTLNTKFQLHIKNSTASGKPVPEMNEHESSLRV